MNSSNGLVKNSKLAFSHPTTLRVLLLKRLIFGKKCKAQLAEKLGIRQNMISDYERGKRRLSPSMAKRIAKTLHIKVNRIS
ncbi:MAG: helix-turn-helix transcriptional regulator [Deltaproteobacteria bacterium]|nr:helix-turn-helix transcriptional regulator [Deltaproteobacteria bacterium]